MASPDAGDGDVLSGDLTSLMWITDLILMNIWWETTNQLYWNLMLFLGVFFHMAFTIQFMDINMAFGMGKRSTNGFGSAPCSFPYWWDDMPPFLPCKLTMAHINGKWNRLHTSGLYMFIHDTVIYCVSRYNWVGTWLITLTWIWIAFCMAIHGQGPQGHVEGRSSLVHCLFKVHMLKHGVYIFHTHMNGSFYIQFKESPTVIGWPSFFWDISTMTNMVAIWVKSCLNLVRRTDLASRRTVNHPMFGCQLGLTTDSEGILQTGTVPKIGGSSRTNDLQLLFFFWMDTQVFELYHFQKRGMNHGSFNFPPVPLAAQVGGQGGSQGIGHSHQPPITRIFGKSPI